MTTNHNHESNPVGNATPFTRNGIHGAIIRRDPGYLFLPPQEIQAVAEQLTAMAANYRASGGARTDDGERIAPDNGIRSTVEPWRWADVKGDDRVEGVKLSRGKNYLFIPDHAVLDTADALVDYAENR